jgi:hypothetical protein
MTKDLKTIAMLDQPNQLEPRVAILESGLNILTKNVNDLTTAVKDNSVSMEDKLERLTIAVTQAQAPKKTDWGTIIAAIALILAIGSAVFWPLNQSAHQNRLDIEKTLLISDAHQKLELHPVGQALVQRLESQIKDHITMNAKMMEDHMVEARNMHAIIEKHTEEKIDFQQKLHNLDMKSLRERTDLYFDKLFFRVVRIEDVFMKEVDKEHDELMQWRQKAMGLSAPAVVVPSIPIDYIKK